MVMMVVMLTVANVGHISTVYFFPLKGLLQGWRLGDNQNQERWCFHIHFFKCIDTFTHKNFYTEEILHTFLFCAQTFLHIFLHRKTFAQMSFDTQIILHNEVSRQRDFSPQTFLHR